jgi:RND superfamily putative drug exporter
MFAFLASFSHRFKWGIVLIWLAAAITLFLVAPKLSEVGVTDQSQFLPQDTESAMASTILEEKFATSSQTAPSSGLIVIYNDQGLSDTDMQHAQQLHDWLVSDAAPSAISSVVSIFESETLSATLISSDNTAMLMSVYFSAPALDTSTEEAINQVRAYIEENANSSQIYFSGDAGLMTDLFQSVQDTIDRTTLVTIILVIVLLLIIYRSPVAVLLPLITIGCSYLVSMGILGYMAQAGMQVSTLAEAYLVVIIFGVGTDYCMFIVSRFREELLEAEHLQAQHIGPVIAASALTVVVAFLALSISRFGMNQTTGYALALGVTLTLVAGLTLTPALMSIFGKKVFWPAKNHLVQENKRSGWQNIGRWVSAHPVMVAVPIIVVLLLPYIAIPQMKLSAGVASQMPEDAESMEGFNIFTDHFNVGEFSPLYLMVQLPAGEVFDQTKMSALRGVTSALGGVQGVSRVDYYSAPASQLAALSSQLESIDSQISQGALPDEVSLGVIQSVGDVLQALPLQYSGIVQSQNYLQTAGGLQQLQIILLQLQNATADTIPQLLEQLHSALVVVYGGINGLIQEFQLEVSSPFTGYLMNTYFSTDLTAARINVILSGNPYSSETGDTVALIRETADNSVSNSTLIGAESFLGGDAATSADIINVNNYDFSRVAILAIIGVLVVIIFLLRSLLAPLYMVLTVLLNYGATLGIATWLFMDIMHKESLIFMIPLFIFIILLALGADYNIFLMSRIREETQKLPMGKAIEKAVGSTGGVITACGIILAGTFATLLTSSLQVVFQIGAAIAIGIIIDTFVVRALLVPAIAKILGRWGWWPSSLYRELTKRRN